MYKLSVYMYYISVRALMRAYLMPPGIFGASATPLAATAATAGGVASAPTNKTETSRRPILSTFAQARVLKRAVFSAFV